MKTCVAILMAKIHSTCVAKDYGLEWHKKKLWYKEKRNLKNVVLLPVWVASIGKWQIYFSCLWKLAN